MFSQTVPEVPLTSVHYNIRPPIRIVCNLVDSIRKTNDLIYSEAMTNDTINEGIDETSTIRNHLQTKKTAWKRQKKKKRKRNWQRRWSPSATFVAIPCALERRAPELTCRAWLEGVIAHTHNRLPLLLLLQIVPPPRLLQSSCNKEPQLLLLHAPSSCNSCTDEAIPWQTRCTSLISPHRPLSIQEINCTERDPFLILACLNWRILSKAKFTPANSKRRLGLSVLAPLLSLAVTTRLCIYIQPFCWAKPAC